MALLFQNHEVYTFLSLHQELSSCNIVQWIIDHKIVTPYVKCPICKSEMKLNVNNAELRCSKRGCNKRQSIFANTFFFDSKLSKIIIFEILYCWLWKYPAATIIHELGIGKETFANYSTYFRELCFEFCSLSQGNVKIGGEGHIVQVDEMCVGRRKYNVGRIAAYGQKWFFGGIDTVTKEVFYVFVPNRSAEVLMEEIEKHVLPGSVIHTDGWRGYVHVEDEFEHYVVNHKKRFVADDGTHTQAIEATNGAVRRLLRRNGTNLEEHLNLYFFEYIWRKKNLNADDIFQKFLRDWSILEQVSSNPF